MRTGPHGDQIGVEGMRVNHIRPETPQKPGQARVYQPRPQGPCPRRRGREGVDGQAL